MHSSSPRRSLLQSLFRRKDQAVPAFTPESVASSLQLEFPALQLPAASIHWKLNLHLQQLADLPSNALSGPVQEDKQQAYQLLSGVIIEDAENLAGFDLRKLHGLNHNLPELYNCSNWDEMATSPCCRSVRLISIRDYNRALSTAVNKPEDMVLLAANWLGERYFWAKEKNACEFIAAVVYARRRELPLNMPVTIKRLRIHPPALLELKRHYYMFALPGSAWADNSFMAYLLERGVPYSRLQIHSGNSTLETLLLPRNHSLASNFGEGLAQAGAQDFIDFLHHLSSSNFSEVAVSH